MDEEDINRLFVQVASETAVLPYEVREVFSKLVATTLACRDRMKDETNTILTVADVRQALDLLLEALRTGKLPRSGTPFQKDLVKLWLDELRPYI